MVFLAIATASSFPFCTQIRSSSSARSGGSRPRPKPRALYARDRRMRSSAPVDGAGRAHVSPARGPLPADLDADLALDHIELADVDADAAHARVLQENRGDLFGEGLDKIDMAAPDHEPDRVENQVIGEDRPHVSAMRAGAGQIGRAHV